jgi:hypothetical protein
MWLSVSTRDRFGHGPKAHTWLERKRPTDATRISPFAFARVLKTGEGYPRVSATRLPSRVGWSENPDISQPSPFPKGRVTQILFVLIALRNCDNFLLSPLASPRKSEAATPIILFKIAHNKK